MEEFKNNIRKRREELERAQNNYRIRNNHAIPAGNFITNNK